MLIKAGVDISRLTKPTRRALVICNNCYAKIDNEIVVTSTFEGTHSVGSLHYANQAFDLRLPFPVSADFIPRLRVLLGPSFDVVLEADHVHVEYDPE